MFGGFDLNNLDLNKTFSDLTSTLPNISLTDILEAGGDSSADASTTLFFNPTTDLPTNNAPREQEKIEPEVDYFENITRKKNDEGKNVKSKKTPKKAQSTPADQASLQVPTVLSGSNATPNSGEVTMLREQLRGREQDVSILQQRLKEKDDTIQAEKAKVKDLRALMNSAEKNEKAITARFELFQQQSNRQIADLEEKLEEMRVLCEDQRTQIAAYDEKIASSAQAKLSDVDDKSSTVSPSSSAPDQTQATISEADSAKIAKLEQNLAKAKARNDKFNKKIEAMSASLREAEEKFKSVEQLAKTSEEGYLAEKVEWEAKMEAKDFQISALEVQIADHLKSIEELQKVQSSVMENNSTLSSTVASLEKALQDAKDDYSQEIDNLNAANQQLEENLKEYTEATRLINDKLKAVSKKQEETKLSWEETKQALKVAEASLKAANDSLKDINKKLNDSKAEADQLRAALEKKDKALKETEGNAKSLGEKVKELNQKYIDAKAEVDSLKYQSSQKDKHIEELDGNYKALNEKMKDMKQRFTDTKAENYNLEKNAESKIIELNAMIMSKDSDIATLRNRVEQLEKSLHDSRNEASQQADKLSEQQQAVIRLTETARELQQHSESLSLELKSTQELYRSARAENDELRNSIHVTAHTKDELVEIHRREMDSLRSQYEQRIASSQATISALEMEIGNYASKLRMESDSADVLENYKKRAQLALKKANSGNATLTAENAKLKAQLDDAANRIEELTRSVEEDKHRLDNLEARNRDLAEKLEEEAQRANAAVQTAAEATAAAAAAAAAAAEITVSKRNAAAESAANSTTKASKIKYSGRDSSDSDSASLDFDGDVVFNIRQETPSSDGKESPSDPTAWKKEKEVFSQVSASSSIARPSTQVSKSWAILTVEAAAAAASAADSTSQAQQPVASVDPKKAAGYDAATVAAIEQEYVKIDRNSSSRGPVSDEGEGEGGGIVSGVGGKSMLSTAIQRKLEETLKELSLRGIELEASQQELVMERAERKKTESRVEELMAFLERSKKLQGDGPDSAVNMEYLKNCVCRFMASSYSDLSEKKRLYPVISTILKLTAAERKQVEAALTTAAQEQSLEINSTLNSIGSTFETLWGWGTASNPGSS